MYRPVSIVLVEALVIGIMNATLYWGLKQLKLVSSTPMLLLICGALIHIIFEYTGGNAWWCKTTY
jgi:hypothetical protein